MAARRRARARLAALTVPLSSASETPADDSWDFALEVASTNAPHSSPKGGAPGAFHAADYDNDAAAELLVSSPWGAGLLKLAGNTMKALMLYPNGTRFGGWLLNTADNHFMASGPLSDGIGEVLVTSPWGLGILALSGTTMASPMLQPNGTRFSGWLLNTADNTF